jgi:hemolysin III
MTEPDFPATDPEWPNIATHGAGLAAAVVGTWILVGLAVLAKDPWQVVSVSLFGASMILLYAASTLYHAVRTPRLKMRLRVLDHAAIYILIAGTYTPFVLGEMRGGWGWSLFGAIWGLAVAGVGFKVFCTGRLRRLSTALYLAMGWLVLVAAGPLMRSLPPATLVLLLGGGVAYTLGTPFYLAERLRHNHAVWHLFVLAGTVCHAAAVGTLLT